MLKICTVLGGLSALIFLYDRYKDRLGTLGSPPQGLDRRNQKLMMLAGSLGGFIPGLSYFFFGLTGYWAAMLTLAFGGLALASWLGRKKRPSMEAQLQALIERRKPPTPADDIPSQMLAVGAAFNVVGNPLTGLLYIGIVARLAHFDGEDPQRAAPAAFVILLMTITGLAWGYGLRNVWKDDK